MSRRSFAHGRLTGTQTRRSMRAVPLQAIALAARERTPVRSDTPLLFAPPRGGYLDLSLNGSAPATSSRALVSKRALWLRAPPRNACPSPWRRCATACTLVSVETTPLVRRCTWRKGRALLRTPVDAAGI